MISERALNDERAISLAEAMATANEAAQNAGVFQRPVRLLIEDEETDSGVALWRINFLPIAPEGLTIRGGDYIVEINAGNGSIHRIRLGQ
jgi:hypothetical protein